MLIGLADSYTKKNVASVRSSRCTMAKVPLVARGNPAYVPALNGETLNHNDCRS